ncbi:hypothetical protein SBRCBS47491_008061 [Sporothrix bragantina]|uniref:Major facilitator superfamily (MFS) profile domain-containing protein n=1 Tax=Sporothrix bragantina TaxID=671064 RepID=A0ABP0CK99_9PEZI
MKPRARLLLCVCAIALGGAIVGIDTGLIATTINQDSFNTYMFPPGTTNASSLLGAIVSLGNAGNVIGSLILGFSLEKLGRKRTVAVATFFTIIGAVMQTAANGVALMIVGRLVAGIAVGMLNGGLPVYISELAVASERGRLVGIFGLMIAIGFCIANWIGYGCSYATGNTAWRLELAMQIPVAVILLVLTFWIPESPRWLAEKERFEEFQGTLRRLYGDQDEGALARTAVEIREQIAFEQSTRSNARFGHALIELFNRKNIRRTAIATAVLQVGVLSGSLAIQNYQSLLYSALGYTGRRSLLISGLYGLMGVAGQIINLLGVSDRWSRVRTMWIGCAILACMLAILTALSAEYGDGQNANGARAGVAAIFLYSAIYAVFFNSTLFTIAAEMFPLHLRGYGVGFSVMCQGISGIWLSQITPYAFDAINWKYYFVFIGCLIGLGTFYFFFLQETNQVSLEQIAGRYGDETVTVDKAHMEQVELGEAPVEKSVAGNRTEVVE